MLPLTKRVLFLNHNAKEGAGTYFRCLMLGRHLAEQGLEVTIFTGNPGFGLARTHYIDGVKVICGLGTVPFRARNLGWDPGDTFYRWWRLQQEKFDVVHMFEHQAAVSFPPLGQWNRRFILFSDWADWWGDGGLISARKPPLSWLNRFESYLELKSKLASDRVTVISKGMFERAVRTGIPSERLHRLPGGADSDKIQIISQVSARDAMGLDPHSVYLGYVGFTQFDAEYMLQAVRHVRTRANRAVKLLLIGGKRLSDELIHRYDLDGDVVQTGFVRNVLEYNRLLASVDMFLLPFTDNRINRGRWPNKIGDYMAAGKPTVATGVGDLVELFDQYPIGRLAGSTSESFAEQITELIEDPKAEEYGRVARQVAEGPYSWRHLAHQLAGWYEASM